MANELLRGMAKASFSRPNRNWETAALDDLRCAIEWLADNITEEHCAALLTDIAANKESRRTPVIAVQNFLLSILDDE